MDDGKVDHPAPIIPSTHSRNDSTPATTDSTPISIPAAVLALQVKVIADSGDIPIIFGIHLKKYLKIFLSHPTNLTQIL